MWTSFQPSPRQPSPACYPKPARLALTLAHQYVSQVERPIFDAVLGNVGSLISFRVGANDAPIIATQIGGDVEAADLTALPNHHAYGQLLIDGQKSPPFSMQTWPPLFFAEKTAS